MIVGKGTGYVGHATIVEGYGWIDARLQLRRRPADRPVLRRGLLGDPDPPRRLPRRLPRRPGSRWTSTRQLHPGGARRQRAERGRGPDQPPGRVQRDPHLPVRVRVGADRCRSQRATRSCSTGRSCSARPRRRVGTRSLSPGTGVDQADDVAAPGRDRLRAVSGRRGLLPLAADRRAATDDRGQRAVHAATRCGRGSSWTTPCPALDTRFMRRTSGSGVIGKGWTVDATRGCVVSGTERGPAGVAGERDCPNGGGPATLHDVVPGAPSVHDVADLARRDRSLRAWRPLSSSCSVCCRRCTCPGARCGSGRGPTGTGSILQVGGFALQREGSLRRGVRGAGRRRDRGGRWRRAPRTRRRCRRRDDRVLGAAVVRRVQRRAVLLHRGDGRVVRLPRVPQASGCTPWRRRSGSIGLVANGVSIVTRGIAADRTPWGNMYEYSSLLTFLDGARLPVDRRGAREGAHVGGFVYAMAVLTMAMAVSFFYVGPTALMPALNSYWRQIHVTSMIVASSLLGIGCLFTIVYLIKAPGERRALAPARREPAAADHGRRRSTPPIRPRPRTTPRAPATTRWQLGVARAGSRCRRRPRWTRSPTSSSGSGSPCGRSA